MIQAIRGTNDVVPGMIGIWHAVETRPGEDELKNGTFVLCELATMQQGNIREDEFIANIL